MLSHVKSMLSQPIRTPPRACQARKASKVSAEELRSLLDESSASWSGTQDERRRAPSRRAILRREEARESGIAGIA